ncbi:MAG: 50S ribosomal protein L18 [Armatimonadota bacterium]
MTAGYHQEGARVKRHRRVRKRVRGTAERPRLCVFRSLRYVYAQLVDDDAGRTLAEADSREPGMIAEGAARGNSTAAAAVGKALGERAKTKGITSVIFDRGGYLYHGRVKALADGAREAGLEF